MCCPGNVHIAPVSILINLSTANLPAVCSSLHSIRFVAKNIAVPSNYGVPFVKHFVSGSRVFNENRALFILFARLQVSINQRESFGKFYPGSSVIGVERGPLVRSEAKGKVDRFSMQRVVRQG